MTFLLVSFENMSRTFPSYPKAYPHFHVHLQCLPPLSCPLTMFAPTFMSTYNVCPHFHVHLQCLPPRSCPLTMFAPTFMSTYNVCPHFHVHLQCLPPLSSPLSNVHFGDRWLSFPPFFPFWLLYFFS